ncbi:5-formyltetrahydrofolate cyclo-ligase [Candidatus Peregrinibacteria bacterium]|nr:5-formyltetrahydrofolate cyclo-ligase [Candidatus Peregrinibacteria bacterium]MBT4148359.1 5-formyltetrahydrofolate cyclo-ligase [Candidatus Peregrinibacteria bacterium]MBT4366674.1 5-formyltetrahydrofolate cyclo-ligase [Candidatus Peregrinibacteria bacterium]MBT4455888.1 5-formyltetrahydrofolate cyclo-ligase [Candidatus Peregrinibacteria bacterium]
MPKTTQTKQSIRTELKKKRLKLTEKEIATLSKHLLSRLTNTPEYKQAKIILLYHPIQNEADPTPLFSPTTKKTFCLPRICKKTNRLHLHQITDPHALQTGRFNIKEPNSAHPIIARKNIDLVITPGLAFDQQGNRIGYGKGYFDRLFKNLSTKAFKIALAYDFQIIENIDVEKHDQKVDLIITEKRTIRTKQQKNT